MKDPNGPNWYILDENGHPQLEPDMLAACLWMGEHPEHKFLARTELIDSRTFRHPRHQRVDTPETLLGFRWEFEKVENNGAMVSTVFLGLDHSHSPGGPPVLWETMVFGLEVPAGDDYDYQERYSSREDALRGHTRAVNVARRVLQEQGAKALP